MWPALDSPNWLATRDTLHLWTQLIGKTNLALSPLVNHWWNVTFAVTDRGLSTAPLPANDGVLQIELDFLDQRVRVHNSRAGHAEVAMRPCTLVEFYGEYMA